MATESTTTNSSGQIFTAIWAGQLLSLAGSAAASFALALTVYSATNSALALASITAAAAIGTIYLAPLAGAVSDRFRRRQMLLLTNLAAAAVAGLLALVAGWESPSLARLVVIVGLVFVSGVLNALLWVTMAASVRLLRPEADLTRVNGATALVESVPTVAGPLLGAAVYTAGSPAAVFLADAATFLVQAVILAAVRWYDEPIVARRALRPFAGARAGLTLILRDPALRYLQLSFAGFNFCNGLGVSVAIAFVLSASAPAQTSWNLALYNTGGAIGLVLGALAVIAIGSRCDRRLLICAAIVAGALAGRLGLALTTIPLLWLLCALLRNTTVQLMNASLTAIWQERIPRESQATVFGARRLLGQGPYPIAVLLGGLFADHVSTRAAGPGHGAAIVLLLTAGAEIALAIGLWATPALRRLAPAS
ncbi:MFS transporter [Nocardia carnea]|uniref:MFS transporter n=1 Tax=Nocardia carnea TaxID=37328 RepID=UPI002456E954|nr:MFS transporter [Nocardia carnea]